ncbi:DUF1828 domain-containing protein [Mannheimia indoligenes]
MKQLGFECQILTETVSYITSPFTYVNDGQVIGAFIQSLDNHRFKITDDANALFNMESRGINITNHRFAQIKQVLQQQGLELSHQAEIICYATEDTLSESIQAVIKGGVIASTMGINWHREMPQDKFEQHVIRKLKKANLPYKILLKNKIDGLSGHQISIPITLLNERSSKLIFTTDVKEEGSWHEAYTILGKLADISQFQTGLDLSSKIVIANSDSIQNKLNQLTLLFNNTAQVYPSHLIDKWIPRLAA